MALRSIIVEDEKHSRETLKQLLAEYCQGVEIIYAAASISEAEMAIKAHHPDLVFLDIELKTGTSFELLESLENINFEIIFTTAFDQYAIRAIKFSSLDYLLKPIDLDELRSAVEKAKLSRGNKAHQQQLELLIDNLKKARPGRICLATQEGLEFVDTDKIVYCKASGSYTEFILAESKKILVSKHLKEYENLLDKQQFMRVHNSYLINLEEVKKFVKTDGGYIVMNNGDAVSLSKGKREAFLEVMSQ